MMKLGSRSRVWLDYLRPGDHHGSAGATEVCADKLRALEWCVHSPGPASMIHIVHVFASQCLQASVLIQSSNLLVNSCRQHVVRNQLTDSALKSFGRSSVVCKDVDDKCVVLNALIFQLVQDLPMLRIGMFQESSVDFHQTQLEGFVLFCNFRPLVHCVGNWRKLCRCWDPSHCFLLLEGDIPHLLPAHVELTLVLVRPLGEDVVWAMRSTWSKVDEERTIWSETPIHLDELHSLVCEIFSEVIAFFRSSRRLNSVCVLIQAWLPLGSFTRQKTIKVAEPQASWVLVERTRLQKVTDRCVVPLAERSCIVSIALQHLCHSGSCLWNAASVTWES
mmetsp:Transcript_87867/g.155791  ORF Transcript_87867/g.155791 Transcript_87867/m.155791 type:complete len:334 (+) Transcript_87867:1229-2230(+)